MLNNEYEQKGGIDIKKLFYNGHIYTLTKTNETVEAFIVNHHLIQFTGTLKECEHQLKNTQYEKINLNGKTVLPGFIDSHLHLIGYGNKLNSIDLSTATTKNDVYNLLKFASCNNVNIVAEGFHEDLLLDGTITKLDLDQWFPNQAVVLIRRCFHTILMNETGIKKWNVEKWNVPEGELGKDSNGQLNGYLYEGAMQKVRDLAITYPIEKLEQYIETAIQSANSYGITSILTEDLSYYGDWKKTFQAYINILESKNPSLKLHLLVHHKVWKEVYEHGLFEETPHPFLQIESVKYFLDGSLGSRTAFLKLPYSDDFNNSGIPSFELEELEHEIQSVRRKKQTVAFHIIGDAAFEMAIGVLEKYPPIKKGQRDRLIHLSVISPDGIEKIRKLPVILDLQPIFYSSDFSWIKDRIGIERLPYAYLLSTFVNSGFICGGSSDAPIESINPWKGIQAAIKRIQIPNTNVDAQKEALSLLDAIGLYTKGSAATINCKRGNIQNGYEADFQIYEKNPFKMNIENLDKLKPVEVFVNGEQVHLKH